MLNKVIYGNEIESLGLGSRFKLRGREYIMTGIPHYESGWFVDLETGHGQHWSHCMLGTEEIEVTVWRPL